jgi:hypothetical protein
MVDNAVEADYKSTLRVLAENLPDELKDIRPILCSEKEREQRRGLNRVINRLQVLGTELHARRREQVDEEEWDEWHVALSAALQLRAASWALKNIHDGTDENWAHDRVIAAKEILDIPHNWNDILDK